MTGPITAQAPRSRGRPRKVQAVEPEAPEQATEPAPARTPERSASAATPVPRKGYRSKRIPLYNSYQGILIPTTHAIPMYKDNWVEVQLEAGVIEEVDL